jgi:hypothetical protein
MTGAVDEEAALLVDAAEVVVDVVAVGCGWTG